MGVLQFAMQNIKTNSVKIISLSVPARHQFWKTKYSHWSGRETKFADKIED
jgi:hypothetical protein